MSYLSRTLRISHLAPLELFRTWSREIFVYFTRAKETLKERGKKEVGLNLRKIGPGNLLTSFVHSLGEGTRPTRGHTKSASISAGHRSSSGVPPSDHSLLDPQPRNNSLLATADPLRQRYRPPMPIQNRKRKTCILYLISIFRIHLFFGYFFLRPLTLLG